jgi:hypothetical protein
MIETTVFNAPIIASNKARREERRLLMLQLTSNVISVHTPEKAKSSNE